MSSYKDYLNLVDVDSPEGQQAAIDEYVKLVDTGETPPLHLLKFVADLLAKRLKHKHGRPLDQHRDFKLFAAWYAAYCDPNFNTLPKSVGGRFAKIGEYLKCDESTARRRAEKFGKVPRGTERLLVIIHGPAYCLLKKQAWNEAAMEEMSCNMDTHSLKELEMA